MKYPDDIAPTIVEGVIHGPVRYESLDGAEMFDDSQETRFINFKPFEKYGKTWFVPHVQKKSSKGWLKTSPDGYHWWHTFKNQEQDKDGNWLPGTERVLYFRKPFSWRFDRPGTLVDGVLRHWIFTKGYFNFSLHWD